jgi:hypothetical protein
VLSAFEVTRIEILDGFDMAAQGVTLHEPRLVDPRVRQYASLVAHQRRDDAVGPHIVFFIHAAFTGNIFSFGRKL